MPKFEPGKPRPENAGRKKGTPNKKTTNLLEIFDKYNFCPAESLLRDLTDPEVDSKLNPKEIADIKLKLMEFKFPRRKAVEHTGADGADLFTQLLKEVDGSEEKTIEDEG